MRTLMLFVACLFVVPIQAAEYNIVDLGTFGGESGATSINNNGQVVGYSYTGSGELRAFCTSSVIQSADNLGSGGFLRSVAVGINNNGQIIVNTTNENGTGHAFTTVANHPISSENDLGSFGGTSCTVAGINDNGQVVGYADTTLYTNAGSPIYHAFRTSFNQALSNTNDLGTLGGAYSAAIGINNKGEIVGWSYYDGTNVAHAYRIAANQSITAANDLGTLGGSFSYATGINDIGQVIGYSQTADGESHAFCTAPYQSITASSDIQLGSKNESITLCDINNLGQMVGLSTVQHGNGISETVVLYNAGGRQDLSALLNNEDWVLLRATGINDLGQICGLGLYQGNVHAFVMNPVPEPSVMLLLCCGLGIVLVKKFW